MDITVISSFSAEHQRSHQYALCSGLAALGIKTKKSFSEKHVDTERVACWGWRKGKYLRDKGHEVLVMERGYIGDRFSYTSLGWNGLNGLAKFPNYPDDNGLRFQLHGGKINPWKLGGDYALILGQVPGDASLRGMDMIPWYRSMAQQIHLTHKLPVYFRPHPDLLKKSIFQYVQGTLPSQGTLAEALEGAAFTACYNSNSSVDSVLAGVPCVVGDIGSMAYDVCSKSIDDITCPERTLWASQLAWRQWSLSEIESGVALRALF